MEHLTINNFSILLTIALPGFIVVSIIDRINPKTKYYELIYIFKCLIYGLISNLLAKAILNFVKCILQTINININVNSGLKMITTVCIAVLIGLKYNNISNFILKKLNIHIKSNIPTAWDYKFSKGEGSYIVITLNDNTQIKGWWGADSFASESEYGCDLYLEKVYYKKGKKEWVEDKENKGIYISKDNIKYIEFKGGTNE